MQSEISRYSFDEMKRLARCITIYGLFPGRKIGEYG
jgi:hypothetical protein